MDDKWPSREPKTSLATKYDPATIYNSIKYEEIYIILDAWETQKKKQNLREHAHALPSLRAQDSKNIIHFSSHTPDF